MKVALINPYELGRQPFGLAEPAAWLAREGCEVSCCDLSIQKLETCLSPATGVVAIYVAMHTATRIAVEALPKIRQLAPNAHLCVYGLYAPMNVELFRSLGVRTIIGGEYETGLVSMVRQLQAGLSGLPRRAAAASISVAIARSCRSITAGSLWCRPASCWMTSAPRSTPERNTSRSVIPIFSTDPVMHCASCAPCMRNFPR